MRNVFGEENRRFAVICEGLYYNMKSNLNSGGPVVNPRHDFSVAAVETWRYRKVEVDDEAAT